MSEPSVLGGFRVLDTATLAGALAGRLLADLGAEVWKVEPPEGDPARRIPPFATPSGRGGCSWVFEFYHAGKRSLVVDPERPGDLEGLRGLLASADVWIDSSAPGSPSRWGLDPLRVAESHPRLVIASVTPFGLEGPFASFAANDLVAQAAGGMVHPNGPPEGPPLQGFGLQAYHAGSLVAVLGVLLALLERSRSGLGQLVEVSLQEAVASLVDVAPALWEAERRPLRRQGPIHWTGNFGIARALDGWILQGSVGDWTTLREWLRAARLGQELDGPEWEDLDYRQKNAEVLFGVLGRLAENRSAEDLAAEAQRLRLPFAPVRALRNLLEDPQLEARRFFVSLGDGAAAVRFPGPPFRMSETPLRTRGRAPDLGSGPWPAGSPGAVGMRADAELDTARGRPLEGIRVLDFTHVVAGPAATRILADHGATVIKVERPVRADAKPRERALFARLNRGKRSIVLDLSQPRGVEIARALASRCDVVIDNFSPRVMEHWGLDPSSLLRSRPDLVAVSMTGFGRTGPRRDWVSFAPTVHAASGYTGLMRAPDGSPVGWGFSWADTIAGLAAAVAVAAALLHRARTGRGQWIDLSEFETAVALVGPALLAVANGGAEPQAPGNRSQEEPAVPHGVFRCAGEDRWVALAVRTDEQWARFARIVNEPWALEPRLAVLAGRIAEQDALERLVEGWTSRRTAEEVTELLQGAGIAAFPVADGADLCERDPHLRWRRERASPGPARGDGVIPRLWSTPGRIGASVPAHGEHTEEVVRELLGLPAEEIRRLRRERVIG